MSGNRLTIIVPSRTQDKQAFFLRRSIKSIRDQSAASQFELTIIVAVDKGERLGDSLCKELDVQCVESAGKSQAAALNAAIGRLECDYVAFLEDDDRWQPHYLAVIQQVIDSTDFVSSNQTEFDADGNLLSFFDFPTPSGWFMPLSTIRQIGEFNEQYRFHLDNEWLGRLNRSGLRRVHLVDSHVPADAMLCKQQRTYLYESVEASGFKINLVRHQYHFPLVQRFVHRGSGMAQIGQQDASRERSEQEYEMLKREFGRVPN